MNRSSTSSLRPQLGSVLRDVDVAIARASRSVDWSAAHERGDVPDGLPYGLDRIEEHGLRPQLIGTSEAGAVRRGLGKLLGDVWLPPDRLRTPEAPLLAWDERASMPHLMGGDGEAVVTGCIWATEPDAPRRTRALARRTVPRAAKTFVLSPAQIPVLQSWGIHPNRLEWVPFGVDVDFWTAGPARSARDTATIIAVGNDRRRDFATLTRALTAVRSTMPHTDLVIAANRAVPAVPGARAVNVGHRALRDQIYANADVSVVLCSPNIHGSGMTSVLESMACRVPVIATDLPGVRPYVRHMETGVLVPVGDPDAVASAIRMLLSDRALADEMVAAAHRRARAEFTTAGMALRLSGLVAAI